MIMEEKEGEWDFCLVISMRFEDFEIKVKEKLNDDWELHGDMVLDQDGHLIQAMIKFIHPEIEDGDHDDDNDGEPIPEFQEEFKKAVNCS